MFTTGRILVRIGEIFDVCNRCIVGIAQRILYRKSKGKLLELDCPVRFAGASVNAKR